ncbi:MAG: glycosyltransferase [Prosthecochloris sp.]|nr:glycosyltransferase [Prosthecochloris sp.]
MIYQLVILVSLAVLTAIVLRNLIDLRGLPAERSSADIPFVSVLVPARNEEHNIRACVESLLAQDYEHFELIVLDDGSTDATADVLRDLLQDDSAQRLKVIDGTPLPEGWHGKAWACHQLGREARGELLLFTDADTVHEPSGLRKAVGGLQESGADLLSLTPRQDMKSFWEQLIVPVMYFILMTYLPLRMVSRSPRGAFCFANGQFLLFRRDFYQAIDGHEAVRKDLVEDVWLCRKVKQAGGKVVIFNGTATVRCRMYRSFGEIWNGFSKNLFAGLGYNTAMLFGLVAMTAMFYVVPYGFVISAFVLQSYTAEMFWLPLLQIKLALLCRILVAVKFRQPVSGSLLHAFSQLMLIAIASNSFYLVRFGRGSPWKGRRYNFSGRVR